MRLKKSPFNSPTKPLLSTFARKQVSNKGTEIEANSKVLNIRRRGLGSNPFINEGNRPYIAVEKVTE